MIKHTSIYIYIYILYIYIYYIYILYIIVTHLHGVLKSIKIIYGSRYCVNTGVCSSKHFFFLIACINKSAYLMAIAIGVLRRNVFISVFSLVIHYRPFPSSYLTVRQ